VLNKTSLVFFDLKSVKHFSTGGINQEKLKDIEMNYNKHNYYSLLAVNHHDKLNKIRKNYYFLSKKFHPDIYKGNIEIFKKLNEAFNIIKDPHKRQEYDKKMRVYSNIKRSRQQSQHSSYYDRDSSEKKENKEEESEIYTTSKYENELKNHNFDVMFDKYISKPVKHKAHTLKVL
jgi:curved DNA-binding protein CbpA